MATISHRSRPRSPRADPTSRPPQPAGTWGPRGSAPRPARRVAPARALADQPQPAGTWGPRGSAPRPARRVAPRPRSGRPTATRRHVGSAGLGPAARKTSGAPPALWQTNRNPPERGVRGARPRGQQDEWRPARALPDQPQPAGTWGPRGSAPRPARRVAPARALADQPQPAGTWGPRGSAPRPARRVAPARALRGQTPPSHSWAILGSNQ